MEALISRLLELAVVIQQIPAPSFHETERAVFVRARFAEENLRSVELDSAGNVYACLGMDRRPETENSPPLVLSAHLDTVFPISVNLQVRREPDRILAPGIGDNSLGVAGLFGLVWALRERRLSLPGNLWLVANVCEEGLGNLLGMQAVVERFEHQHERSARRLGPSRKRTGTTPLAYIIVEGMALGQIYQRGLGVLRYRLKVRTAG